MNLLNANNTNSQESPSTQWQRCETRWALQSFALFVTKKIIVVSIREDLEQDPVRQPRAANVYSIISMM